MWPDKINGIYETFAGAFILLSVIRLHREKRVQGVSRLHVAFFTSWGLWNLFYYPAVGSWFSFWGGLSVVIVNLIWLGQVLYYSRNDRNENPRR